MDNLKAVAVTQNVDLLQSKLLATKNDFIIFGKIIKSGMDKLNKISGTIGN